MSGEVVRFKPDRLNVNNTEWQGEAAESFKTLPGGSNQKLKIPHMGWNRIRVKKEVPILKACRIIHICILYTPIM